jgi:hypothetical protein
VQLVLVFVFFLRPRKLEMAATATCAGVPGCLPQGKRLQDQEEEFTPSTTPGSAEEDSDQDSFGCGTCEEGGSAPSSPGQLQAGVYHDPVPVAAPEDRPMPQTCRPSAPPIVAAQDGEEPPFTHEETIFIFDWDDTVLPSTWVQRQGLRLDSASQLTSEHREILAEVAATVGKTLKLARQHGTVVLVTNAERGWIELSCQKFLPTLAPMLENVKMVSARTTYEGSKAPSPLDWKLRAFEHQIEHFYGTDTLFDPAQRKNVFSLGDSVHEREALMRATSDLPNCHPKSLKFVERPDVSQICKQHELITGCFDRIVHHVGNLDLCIRCP